MTRLLLIAATLVAALCLPAAATAVVPPKNCGTMTVKGKRYQVKADQISCSTGRDHTKRYLERRRKPRGYTCKDVSKARNSLTFRCNNGRKTFFAIRR